MWQVDSYWKRAFPDNKTFLMREHNWAFAAWEIARMRGKIQKDALLVHVDAHLDDLVDGILVDGVFNIFSEEDAIRVAEHQDYSLGEPEIRKMKIENFIWPAVARKTINETIFISQDSNEVTTLAGILSSGSECDPEISKHITSSRYLTSRYLSLQNFFENYNRENFTRHVKGRSVILDLDLDYFNDSDNCLNPRLKSEQEIRSSLRGILSYYDWDVVTVALSPLYCGGIDACGFLLTLFLEEASLNLSDSIPW